MTYILEAIGEVCQCPICLSQVKAPVVQCNNGHVSCSECRRELIKCSICQGDFVSTPARALEQVLEKLPNKCKYTDKGCRETEMNDHELYCEYRQISCRVGEKCEWSGTVRDWLEHVVDKHKIQNITLRKEKYIKYPNPDSIGWCLRAKDEIFLLYFYRENQLLHQILRHVPMKKPKHVYYCHIGYIPNKFTRYFGAIIRATPLKENDTMDSDRMTVVDSVVQDIMPRIIIAKEKHIGLEDDGDK